MYQSITAVLASPLLLQYDTAWQEKASAWVLLGLTVAMSAAMPAIPVVAATTVAAGTLRTAGKLLLCVWLFTVFAKTCCHALPHTAAYKSDIMTCLAVIPTL